MKKRMPSIFSGRLKAYPILLLPIFAICITACVSKGPQATTNLADVLAAQSQGSQEIKDLNNEFFASVSNEPTLADYVLGQGDLLQVTVFESQDLSTTARVGARGFVTLPLLGPVEAKGLSAREAAQKIEDLYAQKYIREPHVNIFVKEQQSAKVTVLGEVQKPGTYDFPSRRHLMDVLAMAEGLTDKAGKIVQVKRVDEETGQPGTLVVDMEELVKKGKAELNLEILRGDVVYVPEAGMVYVDGAVRKPGNYPLKEKLSLQEAIVAAGGFSTTADRSKVKLVRYVGDGKREVIEVNTSDLQEGSTDNLELKDRDVIFVETNTVQAMLYGLRLNLGAGLFGVGYTPPSQ